MPYILLSDAAQEPDKRFSTNPRKGSDMTDDNKRDDKDRKKLSDEEMEDVAGGVRGAFTIAVVNTKKRCGDDNHEIRDPGAC